MIMYGLVLKSPVCMSCDSHSILSQCMSALVALQFLSFGRCSVHICWTKNIHSSFLAIVTKGNSPNVYQQNCGVSVEYPITQQCSGTHYWHMQQKPQAEPKRPDPPSPTERIAWCHFTRPGKTKRLWKNSEQWLPWWRVGVTRDQLWRCMRHLAGRRAGLCILIGIPGRSPLQISGPLFSLHFSPLLCFILNL